jgi:hypothetical protein
MVRSLFQDDAFLVTECFASHPTQNIHQLAWLSAATRRRWRQRTPSTPQHQENFAASMKSH